MKKIALTTFLILFFTSASSAFALPPMPPIGGNPGGPNQPQLPGEPQLPPCVECDQFTEEQPTATPRPNNPTPTPTMAPGETPHPQPCNGCGGSGGDGGHGGDGGQVLGLSATSGENSAETFVTLLGVVCTVLGLRLTKRSFVS